MKKHDAKHLGVRKCVSKQEQVFALSSPLPLIECAVPRWSRFRPRAALLMMQLELLPGRLFGTLMNCRPPSSGGCQVHSTCSPNEFIGCVLALYSGFMPQHWLCKIFMSEGLMFVVIYFSNCLFISNCSFYTVMICFNTQRLIVSKSSYISLE